MEKLLLTVREAAEVVSISRTHAYKLLATGEWPVIKIGRSTRIPVAELRKWVEQQTQTAQDSIQVSRAAPLRPPLAATVQRAPAKPRARRR